MWFARSCSPTALRSSVARSRCSFLGTFARLIGNSTFSIAVSVRIRL